MPLQPLHLATALAVVSLAASAIAQDANHDWEKTYNVGANAALTLESADSSIEIRSCNCSQIQIHTHGDDLSHFKLEEHQEGDHIFYSLHETSHFNLHFSWTLHKDPHIVVETPAHLQLDARTADGDITATNLSGSIQLHSGDGAISLDGFDGTIKLSSSDGSIRIHNATGTLDANTSDGSIKADGKFTSLQVRSSDGDLDLALQPGSNLTAASNIATSDGKVSIELPHGLGANISIAASDGRIDCKLPITTDHYDSRDSGSSHMEGRLNAGGASLNIRSSNGNIALKEI